MDQAVTSVILILSIGLGLPSFLVLVQGHVPRTNVASAVATVGTSAAFAGMGMAFQNYGYLRALLCVLLAVAIGVAVTWLVPRMRGMSLMPFLSIAFLLSYHSAI